MLGAGIDPIVSSELVHDRLAQGREAYVCMMSVSLTNCFYCLVDNHVPGYRVQGHQPQDEVYPRYPRRAALLLESPIPRESVGLMPDSSLDCCLLRIASNAPG